EVMATEEKVCNYIDLPVQHASRSVLKNMNRQNDGTYLKNLFHKLRERIPGVVLRTTLIAGFPGESEEDFAELIDFVKEVKFERLGCFAYSREEDTPAYDLPGQLPEELKRHRADLVMEEQMTIAFALGREM